MLDLKGVEDPASFNYGKRVEGVRQYLKSYDENGVDACWVFGNRSWRDSALIRIENDALGSLGMQYPKRLFPWGSVNPDWSERAIREEIRRMANELGLYGIKLVPVIHGSALTSGGMAVVAEEAIAQGLPIFLHDGSMEYCSAIQVAYFARMFPELRVISGHGGLRDLWRDLLLTAPDLPNLWICLTGPTQWGIQMLYDELGPERLLFGSDGGLGTPALIKAYLRRIDRLEAPAEHKRMILGENAMRFLFGKSWREEYKGPPTDLGRNQAQ